MKSPSGSDEVVCCAWVGAGAACVAGRLTSAGAGTGREGALLPERAAGMGVTAPPAERLCRGVLGSQSRLRSASAASCSVLREEALWMKGTGTLAM